MLKKFAIGLCKTLLVLIVVLGLLLAYAAYAEDVAAKRADEFCRLIQPGTPTAGMRERAISLGAVPRRAEWAKNADGEEDFYAIFTGATPLSRHICSVKAKSGRVISSEISYLD